MRTTVTLDPDVAAELDRLRREEGLNLSEALNTLVRRGFATRQPTGCYTHRVVPLGLTIDVTDVADALETLDGAG